MNKNILYPRWYSMLRRCYNLKNHNYKNYGGRGITVCERWRHSYKNFENDMLPSYKKGLTLDRIDNDGNYEPSNCQWATLKEQMKNKRVYPKNRKRKTFTNSSSGYVGVFKIGNKWQARIYNGGKTKSIGVFPTPREAHIFRTNFLE